MQEGKENPHIKTPYLEMSWEMDLHKIVGELMTTYGSLHPNQPSSTYHLSMQIDSNFPNEVCLQIWKVLWIKVTYKTFFVIILSNMNIKSLCHYVGKH
jgi:hypothetical protein